MFYITSGEVEDNNFGSLCTDHFGELIKINIIIYWHLNSDKNKKEV
jgi:hypothetical protein